MNPRFVKSRLFSATAPPPGGLAQLGLLLLGVCATLYVPIVLTESLVIRPVHLAPLAVGLFTLLFAGVGQKRIPGEYYLAPIFWAGYMVFRHGFETPEGMVEAVRSVLNVLAYLAALRLCGRAGSERFLVFGLIVGCFISLAVCAAKLDLGDVKPLMGSGRWQGFMPGANRLGNLCGICFLLALQKLLFDRTLFSISQVICFGIVVAACAIGLVMSGSRGALLAASATLLLMLAFWKCAAGQMGAVIRIVLAGLLLWAVVQGSVNLFADYLPNRIVNLFEDKETFFFLAHEDARSQLFTIAWEYFLEAPWWGAGMKAKFFSLGSLESSAHDAYLFLLSTSGIIGLLLFLFLPLSLAIRLLKLIWRRPPAIRAELDRAVGSLAALTFIALHATVIDTSQAVHTWLIFALAGAVCYSLEQRLISARVFRTSALKPPHFCRKAA